MMTKAQLIKAYEGWLEEFDWDWFGTLTFTHQVRPKAADSIFQTWLKELERAAGERSFRWVRVKELGAFKDHLHFHILIGGLLTHEVTIGDWETRWIELAGEARISEFDETKGGIRYLLKCLLPDEDFDFEMKLPQERTGGRSRDAR